MNHLNNAITSLKNAKSLHDLAFSLGFSPQGLSYLIYKLQPQGKYKKFTIPKKTGGVREISNPTEKLKLLQKNLANLLQNCKEEMSGSQNIKNKKIISHGFERGLNIYTNSSRHKNKNYILNIDIKDFFDSFNFGRVRGYFIKNKNFQLNESVATIIAQIACHENKLPQGSPSSPIISNLIAQILDTKLSNFAKKNNCTYTRYADDLSFSTNERFFPSAFGTLSSNNFSFIPSEELLEKITSSGFLINVAKIRLQKCNVRQTVTGLVVNKKINVKSEYKHNVRAMVHQLMKSGSYYLPSDKKHIVLRTDVDRLYGMLNFIDTTESKNHSLRYDLEEKKVSSTLKSFLLFKEFFLAKKPTIITEGKTDVIHLRTLLKRTNMPYKNLYKINGDGNHELLIRFFRGDVSKTGKLLGLTGGSGNIKNFIEYYCNQIEKSNNIKKAHPVIILLDNDSGAKHTLNFLESKLKIKFKENSYVEKLRGNLYLILTPKMGMQDTTIEDFFDEETKNTEINGRKFKSLSLEKDKDQKKLSKVAFAELIAQKELTNKDFLGFDKIFALFSSTVENYYKSIA